jgi:hypothetical protein
MPDNTNVNNNSAVVVVGRTAPVPPGQQKAEKSIPVVIASDQAAIPVEEQNKVQSEVALSLLGIPRSEVALGIFADVNTYDVNPSEWTSTPEQFVTKGTGGAYTGIGKTQGHGLTHIPEESGALIEAPADETAILTSKRFFRYQPGRVSSATFGVKTTLIDDNGSTIENPAIRKYGIFDNYDGYYWETRNDGSGDNFSVVRRTQSLAFDNPLTFVSGQTEDYGITNPYDPTERRASENVGFAETTTPYTGFSPKKLGDLVIYRDNLLMTHAAMYDPSLLQPKSTVGIVTITDNKTIYSTGFSTSISNAVYNHDSGLMTITTHGEHGYYAGKFITLSGIAMTCYINPGTPEIYPKSGRNNRFTIVSVGATNQFTVNVGVSTVPTFYQAGQTSGTVIALAEDQYVSYEKDEDQSVIGGFTDTAIYQIKSIIHNTTTGITTVQLKTVAGADVTGLTNQTGGTGNHRLVTPVPFIQPINATDVATGLNNYASVKPGGVFPLQYETADGDKEGYIDTRFGAGSASTLKTQIDAVNAYYDKWVNTNVALEYLNVYEYRVPRSRFSGDRLDGATDELLYSDAVADKRAGSRVQDANTLEFLDDTSIWNLEFDKVTMYKIEFSWYGAVGALFLAYVPVSNGEARWVRVHHLRASNQLKVSSLGNATLPITYLVYGGGNENRFGYDNGKRLSTSDSYGSSSEHIVKYGASYYIDGGDRGTVKLFSHGNAANETVNGSKRSFQVGSGTTDINLTNADNATDPFITVGSGVTMTSYWVGSKVITSEPLDQGVEVSYVDISNRQLHLNTPLVNKSLSTLQILPMRSTALVGIKCRDFIQSSTGKNVRNRTQVYPTRLATGSTGVIKLDLIKSPIFQTASTTTGTLSLSASVNIGKRGKPTLLSVSNNTYLAEGTGVYGYFRGVFDSDASGRIIAILGYLERRAAVTGTPGYYFYALDATADTITLNTTKPFLVEANIDADGVAVSATLPTESTLDALSSVKISPQIKAPIPNTGTIVASVYVPASGEEFNLQSYFDYNKEYLSFPLTNVVDSLYICGSSQKFFNTADPAAEISASLTWEEQ